MSVITKKDQLLARYLGLLPAGITPNQLSITRLILTIPLAGALYFQLSLAALIIFLVAMGLDFIDGSLARLRHRVSDAGKFLDPLADKVVFLLAFIILGAHYLSATLFTAILFLEVVTLIASVAVPSFALYLFNTETIDSSHLVGKLKIILYALGTIALFLAPFSASATPVATAIFWGAALVATPATILYLVPLSSYSRHKKKAGS